MKICSPIVSVLPISSVGYLRDLLQSNTSQCFYYGSVWSYSNIFEPSPPGGFCPSRLQVSNQRRHSQLYISPLGNIVDRQQMYQKNRYQILWIEACIQLKGDCTSPNGHLHTYISLQCTEKRKSMRCEARPLQRFPKYYFSIPSSLFFFLNKAISG